MRLWHKSLIGVLPKNQLVGQLRELALISKNIQELGKPNHILVNKIMSYDLSHYYTYCVLVFEECKSRNIIIKKQTINKILSCIPENATIIDINDLFYDWHNNKYFVQCFYNLEEKYDCGGITNEEWIEINGRKDYIL